MDYIKDLRGMIGHKPVNLVASTVIVIDEDNKILLQKRSEPLGAWGFPGGLVELGECTEAAGKREVFEETGLTIDDLKLLDVFSGEDNHIKLKNGDEYYAVLIAYYTDKFTGTLKEDGIETLECNFFSIDKLPDTILDRHKKIIKRFLEIYKL